jgi:hypothetical protein
MDVAGSNDRSMCVSVNKVVYLDDFHCEYTGKEIAESAVGTSVGYGKELTSPNSYNRITLRKKVRGVGSLSAHNRNNNMRINRSCCDVIFGFRVKKSCGNEEEEEEELGIEEVGVDDDGDCVVNFVNS